MLPKGKFIRLVRILFRYPDLRKCFSPYSPGNTTEYGSTTNKIHLEISERWSCIYRIEPLFCKLFWSMVNKNRQTKELPSIKISEPVIIQLVWGFPNCSVLAWLRSYWSQGLAQGRESCWAGCWCGAWARLSPVLWRGIISWGNVSFVNPQCYRQASSSSQSATITPTPDPPLGYFRCQCSRCRCWGAARSKGHQMTLHD